MNHLEENDEFLLLPPPFIIGLEQASWPGRAQIFNSSFKSPGITWYLDGAHTPESMTVCSEWIHDEIKNGHDVAMKSDG